MAVSARVRFFKWYRTVPLLVMALLGALSVGLMPLPSRILGRYLYPVKHNEAILESSARHGVDPLLVCAIIKCESNWEDGAQSAAGAVGLMQLMPDTSRELANQGAVDPWSFDPENLTDPATNIEFGCAYLAQLSWQLGSTDEVIAAYNAGPGSVAEWLSGNEEIEELVEVISYPETAVYLKRVNKAYEEYGELYT